VARAEIYAGTSAPGLASRASSVHAGLRYCTRDEGGPLEFGNQVLISNHRKLLWSKATVANLRKSLNEISIGVIEQSGENLAGARAWPAPAAGDSEVAVSLREGQSPRRFDLIKPAVEMCGDASAAASRRSFPAGAALRHQSAMNLGPAPPDNYGKGIEH